MHTTHYPAEDDVTAVEVRRRLCEDEELTACDTIIRNWKEGRWEGKEVTYQNHRTNESDVR